MINYIRRIIIMVTLFSILPGMLFAAETGTLKGKVVDAQTGDPLPGANIVIKEIFHGTASGLDGEFVLTNVPVGTNTVTISYLGYQEQEITVEFSANETKTIEVKLQVLTIMGEEAVITAQAYGQRAAINQQLASNVVTNVVSSEKIEELPDANAAEAIGRLPGISLKRNSGEANQVVIRGLSPKYNALESGVINYPNPFNSSTTIRFNLPQDSHVNLSVFDISGRLVETLVDENRAGGIHTVQFTPDNAASSTYFYKLTTDYNTATRKMMLLK